MFRTEVADVSKQGQIRKLSTPSCKNKFTEMAVHHNLPGFILCIPPITWRQDA